MKGGLEKRVAELESAGEPGRVFLAMRWNGEVRTPAACTDDDTLYVLNFADVQEPAFTVAND